MAFGEFAIPARVRVCRVDLECAIKVGYCAIQITAFQKEHPSIVEGVRVPRIQPNGFVIVRERRIVVAAILLSIPPVIEGIRRLGIQPDCFGVVADREIQVATPTVGNTSIDVPPIVARIQQNGLGAGFNRAARVSQTLTPRIRLSAGVGSSKSASEPEYLQTGRHCSFNTTGTDGLFSRTGARWPDGAHDLP
jgi:hypothetical protein